MKWIGFAFFSLALIGCEQPKKELPVTFKPNIPYCSGEKTMTGTFMQLNNDSEWYVRQLPCTGEFDSLSSSDVTLGNQQPSGSVETGIIVFYQHKGTPDLNTFLRSNAAEMGGNAVVVKTVTAQEGEDIYIATVYRSTP
ncbi:hypothetical protein [Enterovibrio coralii]|uniref:Uncharacterized protein n=1 Tax=Enterovibrio coralii TaxID=294935 RepID=A0A135ID26_9GAMM|nr:hypothetical protein [Enterovibrio coralii]KXF83363.1 hypothetical protein ATN88_06800 [Enterovibrio coralii]